MATDSNVAITAGSGTAVDTVTLPDGDKRQVVVVGDPDIANARAPVTNTDGLLVNLGTNNDVAITAHVPGTSAANLGKAEDAAHASGDVGVMALAVRNDAGTALAGTTGDYIPLSTDNVGALRVAITSGAGSGGTSIADEAAFTLASTSVTPIAAVYNSSPDTLTTGKAGALQMTAARGLHVHHVDAAGASITAATDYTHDAALTVASTAGPALVLRATNTTVPSVTATDDAVLALGSMTGKQIHLPYATPGATWSYAAAAGGLVTTGGVTAKAAGGAGIRNYITSALVVNSHATISTEVLIRDGAAGTVLHRGWAQAAGGGYMARFDPPLRSTANTLVEIAEVTATAATGVLVNLGGFVAEE